MCTVAMPASPRLECQVSWIGNTFPGAAKWVQQDIEALCVTPDGTVLTNVGWEEGGGNCGQYKDGDVLGFARHTHGWGAGGGRAVAVNTKYVFIGLNMGNEGGGLKDTATWPPKGFQWSGVSRRQRADFTQAAPFDGGKGGSGDTLKQSFLPVIEAPDNPESQRIGQVSGLAADETRLYASDPHSGKIHVYDTESMREVAAWPFERPGPLALDPRGTLWVMDIGDNEHRPRIVPLKADGRSSDSHAVLAIDPGDRLIAFCFGPAGEMYLLDDNPRQQILRIEQPGVSSSKVTRLGTPGGIWNAKDGLPAGTVGDWRFNSLSAIGADGAGNLYLAHHGSAAGGSTVLESYSPDGKRRWRLLGLCFIDLADVDPQDETAAFTKEERFSLDLEQPAGKEWSYRAYTLDRKQFPDDPRVHIETAGVWVRRLDGQPLLFVNDMIDTRLQVFRFDAKRHGEIAIPSGLFAKSHFANPEFPAWPADQPAKGVWIWRDTNGDGHFQAAEYQSRADDAPQAQGWWVDDRCGVWQATERSGIRYWPCAGRDQQGNPCWNYEQMKIFPHAAEFDQIKRVRYLPETDTLYLAGTKGDDKNQHWKPSGPVIARYDGCLRGERALRWKIVAPYAVGSQGHESCEPMGIDVAGDYVFVPYTGASKEIGFKTGHVEVFRASDGSSVGHLEPSPEIGEIGLQDIQECLRAVRRHNGEYLIFLEDDFKAKNVLYRWRP